MRALIFVLLCFAFGIASAHPGASIHVSADGRVFFVDTGGGVFVLERDGKLVRHAGPAFHWFDLDEASGLAKTRWPSIPGSEIAAVVGCGVQVLEDVDLALRHGDCRRCVRAGSTQHGFDVAFGRNQQHGGAPRGRDEHGAVGRDRQSTKIRADLRFDARNTDATGNGDIVDEGRHATAQIDPPHGAIEALSLIHI